MRKKILAIAIVVCLGGLSVALALTYKMWGVGIFPGTLRVDAYLKTPTAEGSVSTESAVVGIWSSNDKIGESGTEIQLTSGQRLLSFGDCSAEYQNPQEQVVFVKPFETTYVSVYYLATFGYLLVHTFAHDEYYQNTSKINAEVLLDGESKGYGNASLYGSRLSIRLNASIFSHVISFSSIEGYRKPQNRTVTIGNANVTEITETYEKILTPEQEVSVFCRNSIDQWHYELNATSRVDVDRFKQWVRNNRITAPVCFVQKEVWLDIMGELKGDTGWHDSHFVYYIARYAGIYKDDQVRAAEDIFYRLNSSGIDLTKPHEGLMLRGGLGKECYKDDSEYIVTAELEFEVRYVNVEGSIFKFKEEDIDALPNLSTNTEVAGIGVSFFPVRQVYVFTGLSTIPFADEYVPPFGAYQNLQEHQMGWLWTKQNKPGYSYNLREFLKSLRVEISQT